MASKPPSLGPTPTETSSLLLETPSTALLNRVKQELGLESNLTNINSTNAPSLVNTPREPRTHKAIDGTLYIEILVKKDKSKSRTGWFWQHGTEFEIQNRLKIGKNPRV
jgi:hypothetical protein